MTEFTNVFVCVLGIALMFGALFATRVGNRAFPRTGHWRPVTPVVRVLLFLGGAAVFCVGLRNMLGAISK
jgi:hypothetical protein